jgi:hypothetical protein
VIASTALAGVLQLLAAFPGWMSTDTVLTWKQATGESPFRDLQTPMLSWFWSFLAPARIGPLGPLLIQLTAFWVGVAVVGLLASRVRAWIGVLLPWVLLAIPQVWVLGYAWKDSAFMACLVVALALFAWSTFGVTSSGKRLSLVAGALMGASLGFAALVRWYLLPGLLVMAVGMAVLMVVRHGRRPMLFFAVGLAVTTLLGFGFQATVIQPAKGFNSTTALMFDLARLQCKSSPGVTVPAQLVIPGTAPFCDRISAYSITTLFFPPDAATETLRWPTASDVGPVREAWIEAARTRPADMFEVKLEYLMWSLLFRPETYLQPLGNAEQATLFNSADGSVGIGETVGFPSSGGVFMLLGSVPQSVSIGLFFPASVMSPIWFVIVLPLVAGLWRLRSRHDATRWVILLSSGAVFIANFAAISLNAATRLTAPFVVLALLVSVLAFTQPAVRALSTDPEENSPSGSAPEAPDSRTTAAT